MRKSTLIIILLIFVLAMGCTIPRSEEPDLPPTAAASGTPPPTETAFVDEMVGAYMDENVAVIKELADFSALYETMPKYNEQDYESPHAYIHELSSALLASETGLNTSGAATELETMLRNGLDVQAKCTYTVDAPDPSLLAVLLYSLDGSVNNINKINAAGILDYEVQPIDSGYTVDVRVSFPGVTEMLDSICMGDTDLYIQTRLMYAYMLTIYDEDGEREDAPGSQAALPEGYVFPLEKYTRLTDTWLADRNNGTRKHTGTDILANENVDIYSCTDATVLHVGYNDGTGNFVWTRDSYGYEYIYMHMVKKSDFLEAGDQVSAGDLIGNVGNTGNSATNHLHLSVITPDGDYLNPFKELAAALERKMDEAEKAPEATGDPEDTTTPSDQPETTATPDA